MLSSLRTALLPSIEFRADSHASRATTGAAHDEIFGDAPDTGRVSDRTRHRITTLVTTPSATLIATVVLLVWYAVVQYPVSQFVSDPTYRMWFRTAAPRLEPAIVFAAISHSDAFHLLQNVSVLLIVCPYLETRVLSSRRELIGFLGVTGVLSVNAHALIWFYRTGELHQTLGVSGAVYAALACTAVHALVTRDSIVDPLYRTRPVAAVIGRAPPVPWWAADGIAVLLIGLYGGRLGYQLMRPELRAAEYAHLTGAVLGVLAVVAIVWRDPATVATPAGGRD